MSFSSSLFFRQFSRLPAVLQGSFYHDILFRLFFSFGVFLPYFKDHFNAGSGEISTVNSIQMGVTFASGNFYLMMMVMIMLVILMNCMMNDDDNDHDHDDCLPQNRKLASPSQEYFLPKIFESVMFNYASLLSRFWAGNLPVNKRQPA